MFQKELFVAIVLPLFSVTPSALAQKIPTTCTEGYEENPCYESMLSWDSATEGDPGSPAVCSGVWEYNIYSSCHVSHPDCGDSFCLSPACCVKFSFGSDTYNYSKKHEFSVPNRRICEKIDIRTMFTPSQTARKIFCYWIPDTGAARTQCKALLVADRAQFTSKTSVVTQASVTSPQITHLASGSASSSYQCEVNLTYEVAKRRCTTECGCYYYTYPYCRMHGPDYCSDDTVLDVRYSEVGLTEEELLANYEDSEYHVCTTCEDISNPYEKFLCLKGRLDTGPWPEGGLGQAARAEVVKELKLLFEIRGLDLIEKTYGPFTEDQYRDLIDLYRDHPDLLPTCGHNSESVGTCGTYAEVDPLMNLCVRLSNQHTHRGVHWVMAFFCRIDVPLAYKPHVLEDPEGCAWWSYADELTEVYEFIYACRPTGSGGPAEEGVCISCNMGLE